MKLSTSDRKALIKLAGDLPVGSEERRAILGGLRKAAPDYKDYLERMEKEDWNATPLSEKEWEAKVLGKGKEKPSKKQQMTDAVAKWRQEYKGQIPKGLSEDRANKILDDLGKKLKLKGSDWAQVAKILEGENLHGLVDHARDRRGG
jgi:hypothetical protein